MTNPPLRVAFLTGGDTRSTRMSIEAVCGIPGIVPAAILIDTHRNSLRQRYKNLRRNIKKEGWGYLPARALAGVRALTDEWAEKAVLQPSEISGLLRRAFQERCFSLEDIGKKYGVPIRRVGNLNGPAAIEALQACNPDLGIVLGTRILKPATFGTPRLGSINLHKGKVPEYRGMPPGFWELYDGAPTAGVTVHFVDSKLDTGSIIDMGEVPIQSRDTPDTILEKLHQEGVRVLVRAVRAIQAGTAEPAAQSHTSLKPRTRPTRKEVQALRKRLPHWQEQSDWSAATKNLFYLALYYSGVYQLVRKMRRNSRAAILLYHRVNDFSNDPLTVTTDVFAGQLLAISKYYRTMRSADLVDSLRQGIPIPPTTVLIHFDDAYRDVHTNGRRILQAMQMTAAAFISSGFVNTDREFQHDQKKYPFRYENCCTSDLQEWIGNAFEIGAHTINHTDLGQCSPETARQEIVQSRVQLEQMTGQPVSLFSFPFGKPQNITEQAVQCIRETGYSALFSAYGGFVGKHTPLWDIPRLGISFVHKPLWLLMEIEGLTPAALARRFTGASPKASMASESTAS